jgi:hypothetical protein
VLKSPGVLLCGVLLATEGLVAISRVGKRPGGQNRNDFDQDEVVLDLVDDSVLPKCRTRVAGWGLAWRDGQQPDGRAPPTLFRANGG